MNQALPGAQPGVHSDPQKHFSLHCSSVDQNDGPSEAKTKFARIEALKVGHRIDAIEGDAYIFRAKTEVQADSRMPTLDEEEEAVAQSVHDGTLSVSAPVQYKAAAGPVHSDGCSF